MSFVIIFYLPARHISYNIENCTWFNAFRIDEFSFGYPSKGARTLDSPHKWEGRPQCEKKWRMGSLGTWVTCVVDNQLRNPLSYIIDSYPSILLH